MLQPWLSRLNVAMIMVLSHSAMAMGEAFPVPPSRDQRQQRASYRAYEAFRQQDWSTAAFWYERITRRHPGDTAAWFRLGYSRHALGEFEEAITAHQRATADPRFKTIALYNLGCAYALSNQPDKAFEFLGQAIDAGFNNAALLASDADLNTLRADPRFEALAVRLSPESQTDAEDEAPIERAFDFWIGEWDVLDPQGKFTGTSRITSETGGRVIEENWLAANGATGKSINYVNAEGKWKQHWVDKDGEVIDLTGDVQDGGLSFEGQHTYASGYTERIRVRFKPMPNGQVHQLIEQSKDEGKTWYTWFDGTYIPRSMANEPDKGERG